MTPQLKWIIEASPRGSDAPKWDFIAAVKTWREAEALADLLRKADAGRPEGPVWYYRVATLVPG